MKRKIANYCLGLLALVFIFGLYQANSLRTKSGSKFNSKKEQMSEKGYITFRTDSLTLWNNTAENLNRTN